MYETRIVDMSKNEHVPEDQTKNIPKVILTVFAGRKQFLEVLMQYVTKLHCKGVLHEVHLWDYTRKESDGVWLNNTHHGDFVHVIPVKSKHTWQDYYTHYTSERYPNHVIVKCDDDIVFMDIEEFNKFIMRTNNDTVHAIRFASIVNNGVCAYYQQKMGLIPYDITTFPYDTFRGKLWDNGLICQHLHEYFTNNATKWIEKSRAFPDDTISHFCGHRVSINFFAIPSRSLYLFQHIRADDEKELTIDLTQAFNIRYSIDTRFTVAHLAFFRQRETGLDEEMILQKYCDLITKD